MDERCVCPTCGRPHKARKTIDYAARAKAAADSRWARKSRVADSVAEVHEKVEKLVRAHQAVQRVPASVETDKDRMQREFIERMEKKGKRD